MQETQEMRLWSLDQEDPLEGGMATHSSILVWRTPWTEEPGGLRSMGSQRVRHDWVTLLQPTLILTTPVNDWVLFGQKDTRTSRARNVQERFSSLMSGRRMSRTSLLTPMVPRPHVSPWARAACVPSSPQPTTRDVINKNSLLTTTSTQKRYHFLKSTSHSIHRASPIWPHGVRSHM